MPKQEREISLVCLFGWFFSMAHPYSSFTYIFSPGSAPEILNFLKDHTPLGKKKRKIYFLTPMMGWKWGAKVLNT